MPPGEKIIRHVLVDEFLIEKELDYTPAEAFGHLREVTEWNIDKIAVFIKAAFQEESMEVGIPPQKLTKRLELEFILHLV